jgi:ribosomal protein S18 acetylase RimI-like enzyme
VENRLLTGDDAKAYWDFRLEALEQEPEAFGASAEEHRGLSLEDVKSRLGADSNSFVVGAFARGQLIGTAGFFREKGLKTRHRGRIWGVYVTRRMRDKRIGRELLQELLQRAASIEGIEQILLSVASTQAAATALYRWLGFEPFGREPRAL